MSAVEVVTEIHRKREDAIAIMACALDDYWGGRYQPHAVEELHDEMGAILDALFANRVIQFRDGGEDA